MLSDVTAVSEFCSHCLLSWLSPALWGTKGMSRALLGPCSEPRALQSVLSVCVSTAKATAECSCHECGV